MRGAIHPHPQYAFMASCLVKHRDNFAFTLLNMDEKLDKSPRRKKKNLIIRNVKVMKLNNKKKTCLTEQSYRNWIQVAKDNSSEGRTLVADLITWQSAVSYI
jgi:hypothetical protein